MGCKLVREISTVVRPDLDADSIRRPPKVYPLGWVAERAEVAPAHSLILASSDSAVDHVYEAW